MFYERSNQWSSVLWNLYCGSTWYRYTNRAQRTRKFKEVQPKKLVDMKSIITRIFFHEIAFLEVLNFFPVQKLIFGHFWNCKKHFVKLIYLISRVFLATVCVLVLSFLEIIKSAFFSEFSPSRIHPKRNCAI